MTRRQILTAGIALAAGISQARGQAKLPKLETLTGKVRIERKGPKLLLIGEDSKTYPLVQDAGSRLFLKDERLLERPMRLTGRMQSGGSFQVVELQSLIKGVPHDVYYWCDVCSIRRYEKMICECCGAPMILKEEPVKK